MKSSLDSKKNILVVSLGNEFDIISFTGIYKNLKKSDGTKLTLLIKNSAKSLVPFLTNVDRVLFFDEKRLQNRINDDSYSLVEKYKYLEDYINELTKSKYDLIVNLSHTLESARIINVLNGDEKKGFLIDDCNKKIILGKWFQVFFAAINADRYNAYSHYDIMLSEFDVNKKESPPFLNSDSSLDSLYKKVRDKFGVKDKELILLSCASKLDEKSRWNLDSIAKLATELSKKGEKVVVFAGLEGENALNYVKSYADNSVTCEKMLPLDLVVFMKYTKVLIAQGTPLLSISAASQVPMISVCINEINFREHFPSVEGSFIIDSKSSYIPETFFIEIVDAINSNYVGKILTNREELEDIPVIVPEGYGCYFTRFDNNNFLRFDSLARDYIDKEGLYLQLYRQMWQVILNDKMPQEAFNDYIDVLRCNFRRNEILSSIAFAKYDIGTVEMLQEKNKSNLERVGSIKNRAQGYEKIKLNEIEKLNRETLMLFNKNPFLSLVKFYFLIIYENLPQNKDSKDYINELFKFLKTMDNIFSFMSYCLINASDVIFEDYNVLDEVVNSDDSMIYH